MQSLLGTLSEPPVWLVSSRMPDATWRFPSQEAACSNRRRFNPSTVLVPPAVTLDADGLVAGLQVGPSDQRAHPSSPAPAAIWVSRTGAAPASAFRLLLRQRRSRSGA